MRKCILLSVMLMAAMCLVSCSDSPDTLSASTAKKLFKKEVKRLNQLDSYADVQIGYFTLSAMTMTCVTHTVSWQPMKSLPTM